MRFRILTVVWGDAFTERFLHFTLRSLLAPGNLRDLARLHEVTYHVYAPDDDFARMQASARFEQIASIVAIRHCKLSLASIDPRNAMSHWDPWKAGVAAARNDDVFVILVAPDHIFCRGALARWGGLLERGHLAVFSPGFQVAAETLGPELRRRFPEDSPIDLSVEDLHDVIFRHLHPIKIAMFGGNPHPIGHPEWHLRAVHGRGFVQRIVGSHAVAFHPRRIRLTDNFCPIEKLDRVAFEPSWFIGAEPLLKHVEMLLQPASIDDATLSYYGGWADRFITPANLRESAITHVYELAGDMPVAERRRAERAADFHVGQIHASRSIFRVWQKLHDAGLYQAARWVAAAHMHGRLRRHFPIRGPVTLFVPHDGVLERLASTAAAQLMADHCRPLIGALRAHVADGHLGLTAGTWLCETRDGPILAGDGRRYAERPSGAVRVLSGPLRADDMEIYVVDGALVPLELSQPGERRPLAPARRALRHRWRRSAELARMTVLALLEGNRRSLVLALRARELWRTLQARLANGGVRRLTTSEKPDAEAVRRHRTMLAARAMRALRELYHFHWTEVLAGKQVAEPAELLAGLGDVAVNEEAADSLPSSGAFAEAALELGYLRRDQGDDDGAIGAFRQALALPAISPGAGRSSIRALAATELAELLRRRGRSAEALAVLDSLTSGQSHSWRLHLCRARALVDVGSIDAALAEFERSLRWNGLESTATGRLPRDLGELAHMLDGGPLPGS